MKKDYIHGLFIITLLPLNLVDLKNVAKRCIEAVVTKRVPIVILA